MYFLELISVIRGYHVYKYSWKAETGEKLVCKPNKRKAYNNFAVSVYKKNDNDYKLVGHVPLECSYTFHKFIEKPGNMINIEVTGSGR